MSSKKAHIELKQVSKSYYTQDGSPVHVLHDVDLSISKGQTVAIHGPSGSGKSTLLNLIGGLDTADSGDIIVADKNISNISADDLATYRNTNIGFVFQLHHLLPQCTLRENILIPVLAKGPSGDADNSRASELMKRLGIASRSEHFPSQLSGGERLRAAVARSLINEPEVLLADEPTGSLDEDNAMKLTDLLLEINESLKLTIVLVTHAQNIADRMQSSYRIRSGTLEPLKA